MSGVISARRLPLTILFHSPKDEWRHFCSPIASHHSISLTKRWVASFQLTNCLSPFYFTHQKMSGVISAHQLNITILFHSPKDEWHHFCSLIASHHSISLTKRWVASFLFTDCLSPFYFTHQKMSGVISAHQLNITILFHSPKDEWRNIPGPNKSWRQVCVITRRQNSGLFVPRELRRVGVISGTCPVQTSQQLAGRYFIFLLLQQNWRYYEIMAHGHWEAVVEGKCTVNIVTRTRWEISDDVQLQ